MSQSNSTFLIIIGTRPEAIKLIPVYLELKKNNLEVVILNTGQHSEMIQQVFDFFNIKSYLSGNIKRSTNSLSELTSQLFVKIEKVIQEIRPKLIIVQGDTTSAFVGSICSFYNKIKVAHIEAGLRTNNKYSPFPEEVNRRLISEVADLHFAPTKTSAENLLSINKSNVFITGNTVIDALQHARKTILKKEGLYKELFGGVIKESAKNVLITGHRRESFGEGFKEICSAIKNLAKEYEDYNFIYPVHLNPQVKEVVFHHLYNVTNVHLLDPLPYDSLLYIMEHSKIIMTDSGGIQEEAPSFDIPVVVMRNHTERQEGIEAGCSILAGTKKKSIISAFKKIMTDKSLYNTMAKSNNPYGDGTASEKIVKIIQSSL